MRTNATGCFVLLLFRCFLKFAWQFAHRLGADVVHLAWCVRDWRATPRSVKSGRRRDREELREGALNEEVAGKPVPTASTTAYGCSVNRSTRELAVAVGRRLHAPSRFAAAPYVD